MTSIENGPAQVPNSQPNNEPRNNTTGVHPERVDSTLGGDTPAHPDYEPTTPSRGEVESRKGRTKYIVGGAAVMSVLVAAGAYFVGAKAGTESSPKPIEGSDESSNSASSENSFNAPGIDLEGNTATFEVPVPVNELTQADIEAMPSDSFINLDDAVRLNSYGPMVEEFRNDAYAVLYKYASSEERALISNDFPINKADFSDQDILNQYAIDIFGSSAQGSDPIKIDQGRKLQAVIMSPDNPRFDENSEKSGGAEGMIKAVREATVDYPRLSNVTFRGHNIGSNGAEIIRYTSPEGREGVSLFTLLETPEGNSVWQYTDEYFSTDPTIEYDISQAVADSKK